MEIREHGLNKDCWCKPDVITVPNKLVKKKRYWHELSDSTIKRLIKNHVNWGEIIKRYRQPNWCGYPNALGGVMGCWSLTDKFDLRHKISVDYCKNCDCFKGLKRV